MKLKHLFAILLFLFIAAIPLWAAFPGISYNIYEDFEQCANTSAPTATCLTNSEHGAGGGSWSVTNPDTILTIQSGAQGTETGTSGTHGFQYAATNASTQNDFIQKCFDATCTFATSHNSISVGFFYVSGTCSAFNECAHAFVFGSNSLGDLTRMVDERDSVDNTRQLRISPCNTGTEACRVDIADATGYWVTIKYVFNGSNSQTTQMKVYTPSYGMPSTCSGQATPCSATWTSGTNDAPVDHIVIGSNLSNQTTSFTNKFDDILFDWTNANYPVLPVNTFGSLITGGSVLKGSSVIQ